MSLAIFDLDETLLAGDSCSLFCQFLVDEGLAPTLFLQQDAQMMVRYHAQTLVLSDYIRFLLTPLMHLPVCDIDTLMPLFVERYIRPRLYPEALQLLASYQQQGIRLLIISATSEFIVKAIAKALGINDFLAIQLTTDADFYTGDIRGIATFREGKVKRLKQWLNEQQESLDGAFFYSDSINDLPLLEQVENPVAVNPDAPLLAVATQQHWPVLQWSIPDLTAVVATASSGTPSIQDQSFIRPELNHV
ncbi:HAD family hydrolase [Amphritea opalescens]|uniref:HAD family hydrolase n=1 Tax=Amphritea opalescens TaxID=2490544 RepID=A0A430KRQ7_9GAMM|nr:HAD family hydrolase [Amphritea opalescens]RTE66024.1 HAD family hydrolase [Amphritea opalescens]